MSQFIRDFPVSQGLFRFHVLFHSVPISKLVMVDWNEMEQCLKS